MRLKIATIAFTAFSILVLISMPLFVIPPHGLKAASKHVQAEFVVRSGAYIMVLLLSCFVTLVLSWLLYRRTREEYRTQTLENLKELLEGTLQDHDRKRG